MSTGLAERGVDSYRRAAVESSSPVQLVVMLYDGALRFCADARAAILRRDVPAKGKALSRVIAIVGELQATLDLERGGEVAHSLHQLYSFLTDRLLAASYNQHVEPLDDVVRVLTNLREGWAGISAQEKAAK
ncbi:MAG: flagellar export chaperone FliS [Acidobacteria bacterium]|nr:flagellar export chaperone FliS [Acidobacteriota bacterium]